MTQEELTAVLENLDPEGAILGSMDAVVINQTLPDGAYHVQIAECDVGRYRDSLCLRVKFARENWERTVFYDLENVATLKPVKREIYNLAGLGPRATPEAVLAQIVEYAASHMTVAIRLTTEGQYQNVRIACQE